MKIKHFFYVLFLMLMMACGKTADYTTEFIKETSGSYLFNANEVIEVYFENNELFLKWRGAEKIEPIYLGDNTYFIKEMNKKIAFVKPAGSQNYVISEIPEDDAEAKEEVNYKKLPDSAKVASDYLKDKEYDKALEGYLAIQKEDSNSGFLNQYDINRFGNQYLKDENYKDAIAVFKLNSKIHPKSDNVYSSLANAYAKNGDSLQAYNNYKIALKYNTGNRSAKKFISVYDKK